MTTIFLVYGKKASHRIFKWKNAYHRDFIQLFVRMNLYKNVL